MGLRCDENTLGFLWRINGIQEHMKIYGSCPDCGDRRGRRYNDGYIYIIECSECYSSFYPNANGIIRFTKGYNTKRFNVTSTTFRHYIDVHVDEYRGIKLVQE
jgi:ribosomal protein L37AE/L43A